MDNLIVTRRHQVKTITEDDLLLGIRCEPGTAKGEVKVIWKGVHIILQYIEQADHEVKVPAPAGPLLLIGPGTLIVEAPPALSCQAWLKSDLPPGEAILY